MSGKQYTEIHGHAKRRTPTYKSWLKMRDRCNNPNHVHFDRYGGSGIAICERWDSFANFLEDMGERPPGKSLDRIENARGYCKENCRWASCEEQQRNKRTNHLVTIAGQTKCLGEWSEISGIPYQVLRYRVRQGWTQDRLLGPVEPRKPRKVV